MVARSSCRFQSSAVASSRPECLERAPQSIECMKSSVTSRCISPVQSDPVQPDGSSSTNSRPRDLGARNPEIHAYRVGGS